MSSKLTKEVIRNLINQNPTSKEIDFLIYIAMYQDADGVCRGIYYKDVMEALPCCKQTFYSVKKSLEQKGIIRTERESDIDYDITILGNDKSYQGGYLNVRKPVLHTQDFKSLPAGAKMIAIDLINLVSTNGAWEIGKDLFYKKYTKEFLPFEIKKKTLREYIHILKKILKFDIEKTGSKTFKFVIKKTENSEAEKPYGYKSNNEVWTEHLIACLCRRNRFPDGDYKQIRDTADLILQYRQAAEEKGHSICKLIMQAFGEAFDKIQKKIVNSKLIHKIIRKELYNEPLPY